MYTKVLLLLIIGCAFSSGTSEYSQELREKLEKFRARLPKDFKQCTRNDPDRDACIKTGLQQLIHSTEQGVPEMNFPPLDPYTIRNTAFNFKRREFDGRIEVKEGQVYGISKMEIRNVRSSFDNDIVDLEIDAHLPEIKVEGTYRGNILVNKQRHTPKGYCNVTMSEADIKWRMIGDIIKVNGVDYLNVTRFDMTPNVEDFNFYATGLVPDPMFNNIIVSIVNTNWKSQYKKLFKDSKTEWEPLFIHLANNFFKEVPYDEIFPK